jgi:hypothetical protein
MLKNKKILLLCKETFSYPLYFLAKDLIKENSVASYFFNPAESSYNKCDLNRNTYYKHKELEGLEVFDTNEITEHFTKNIKTPKVDMNYIHFIEEEYTHFKNINLQLLSTQKMSTYYHDRIYYRNSSNEQQLYWLELNYKNAIQIIDTFQPDTIIDIDNSELARNIINEIAYKKNIPYITIDHPRYELFKIPTYNLGLFTNEKMVTLYNEKNQNSKKNLIKSYNYINQYRAQKKIMSSEYKNDITSKYERDSLLKTLKTLIEISVYFWNQDISSKNLKLKNSNKILFAPSLNFITFYAQMGLRKWYLYGKNSFFNDPDINDKYVYMPLHLIPESSTLTAAPFYINELTIIEQVSKSLPAGWKLYVKEHQAMLGQRSLKFYKKVNYLHNVTMVSINYYKDPKPWISNSQGVITITGTSAYESVMLGKKAIVFGDVPFNLIEGVIRTRSFEDLPSLLSSFGPVDNIHSCAAYISAIETIGTQLNLKYLMTEGEAILLEEKKTSEEFQKQIDQLSEFFEKAYESYTN